MGNGSSSIDVWTPGLVAAGLMLVVGILFLSFSWEAKSRRRASSATTERVQFERTEGGEWPTVRGDGGGGGHH
ncbi:conserved hypothetical protein [Agrobacterium genomosp. 2 str. CFBP 5494]|uniref:Uncharacterized protein n=1 Tax=Agrobacterium genomosp. 2 str. CFBP 5494 TaxID=1183436 RepID=A0A9W5F1P1_9HYPH|nr:hypothetical protein BW45_06025 [Agrobacterium tumefaciens]CUW88643.1 conserved hypothetical protein [Agrobacterium genomosp. 2 str. CFBP 5494]